jgi:excinuclease ABC subunit A
VTYLKAFDPIRELFAATKDAKSRGLTASHFSFNVPGGRCEACQGEGEVRVEMQFLADVFVPCEQCDGRRFKQQVLDVRYRGKNITQVLDMTVRERRDLRKHAKGAATVPSSMKSARLPAPRPA